MTPPANPTNEKSHMIKVASTQLWVHDQDEALAFYTTILGMEVRQDVTMPEMGNFRWLTVGPPKQPDVAIVLMEIPGSAGDERGDRRAGAVAGGQGLCRNSVPGHR